MKSGRLCIVVVAVLGWRLLPLIQRRLAVRRHEDLTPLLAACTLFAACPLTRNPLLAACLTRYSDVTLSRLAGDMFGCLPSHRPTSLFTKPQLLHPLLPVCCGAMGVPFDALYYIGMCTCTRLRSMTTTTKKKQSPTPTPQKTRYPSTHTHK